MNVLDWMLVVVVLAYALSGYWQGFVTGAFATAGLLLGGLFGIWLAPRALGDAEPSLLVSLGALFIVILAASLGQALFQYAGARIRARITWQPVRALDAVGGAALSAAAVLLVAWALGVAISGSRIGAITPAVRESAVLAKVNEALPLSASSLLSSFDAVVGTTFFPRYLEPFTPERIVEVAPGDRALLGQRRIAAAEESVLKIRGSNSCGRGVEGTGFLYARDRLMTNAHVVAGVSDPEIIIDGGSPIPAEVVLYDAKLDLAVLDFDSGDRAALDLDGSAQAKDPVVILGYPEDGPYDAQAARIRSQQRLNSPDIYGAGSVTREVFALRGLVRPGNSGGPILARDGDVVGVVFAASVTDSDTGYALTADQVSATAAAGRDRSAEVSTGSCAS